MTLNAYIEFYATNPLQMRISRLEVQAVAKSRAEKNCLNTTHVFKNKVLDDSIKAKDSLKDLNILNNQYLQSIIAETIFE